MTNIIIEKQKGLAESYENLITEICASAKAQGVKFVLNEMYLEGIKIDCSVFMLGSGNYIEGCEYLNGPLRIADGGGGNCFHGNK